MLPCQHCSGACCLWSRRQLPFGLNPDPAPPADSGGLSRLLPVEWASRINQYHLIPAASAKNCNPYRDVSKIWTKSVIFVITKLWSQVFLLKQKPHCALSSWVNPEISLESDYNSWFKASEKKRAERKVIGTQGKSFLNPIAVHAETASEEHWYI